MSIAFDYKPWKVKLQITPKKPIASLVSLYDLIADEDGNLRATSLGGYSGATGVALSHDLIYYNAKFWGSTGTIEPSNELSDWELLGIDIGPVTYDSRAKHKVISIPTESKSFFDSNASTSYTLYNKSAALYPSLAEELYLNIPHGWTQGTEVVSYAEANPFTVGTSATASDADILLTDPDSTFNATLVNATGVSGYTGILLNISSSLRARTFLSSLTGIKPESFTSTDFLKDATVTLCLKNTYVWVRTSFFGDYINPDSFEQTLTPDSDVIHSNLLLSSKGDFNRYDGISKVNTDVTKKSENTRPYIPQTSPSVDLLSNRIIDNYSSISDEALNSILAEGSFNTEIGSLKTEPKSRETDAVHILYPPTYLDPETPKTAESLNGERPIIVPKEGNNFSDGRITGPTIDELWHYIKRLVSGRDADSTVNRVDTGYIYQTSEDYINDKSTLLNQPTDFTIPTDYISGEATLKKGDPLETIIKSVDESGSSEAIALVVNHFVNAPQSFKYNLFEQLKDIHGITIGFNDIGYSQNLPLDQENGILSEEGLQVAENTSIATGDWSPRTNPLSLRELEVSIMELKYNLIYAFKEINANFSVVGSLGKKGSSVETPNADFAGSLYMLHKDYNGDRSNPNTYFNPLGNPTGEADEEGILQGASAEYSDDDYTEEGTKAFLASNYGNGSNIPESQAVQTSAYTFLAADGKWRTMEHIRLPILDEEY